jgi:hypothetical protein
MEYMVLHLVQKLLCVVERTLLMYSLSLRSYNVEGIKACQTAGR